MMNVKNAMAAAGMLALLGATAACGSNTSSTAGTDAGTGGNATGAAAAPKAATTDAFCKTLTSLGAETTPSQGAQELEAVGTPSDTSTSERHGFEVFVDGVATLPDNATSKDFGKMEKAFSTADAADVQAFVSYVGKECAPATSSSPSAPSS
jgi:hypothetical protein